MRRTLLIKPKRIGDTLLLTPTISALKKTSENMRVEVLVHDKSAAILQGFDKIDCVWTVTGDGLTQKLTRGITSEFDDVIELSGQPFSGRVLNDCLTRRRFRSTLYGDYGNSAALVSSNSALASLQCWMDEHAVMRDWLVVRSALKIENIPLPVLDFSFQTIGFPQRNLRSEGRYAVLQPFSRGSDREWSLENWRTLAMQLLDKELVGEIVVPYGSEAEHVKAACIVDGLVGCRLPVAILTFFEHANLVKHASVCITCNTGVMHLAAAVGAKVVVVWGATPIRVWYPWCEKFSVVCANQIFGSDAVRGGALPIQECSIRGNIVETVFKAAVDLMRTAE